MSITNFSRPLLSSVRSQLPPFSVNLFFAPQQQSAVPQPLTHFARPLLTPLRSALPPFSLAQCFAFQHLSAVQQVSRLPVLSRSGSASGLTSRQDGGPRPRPVIGSGRCRIPGPVLVPRPGLVPVSTPIPVRARSPVVVVSGPLSLAARHAARESRDRPWVVGLLPRPHLPAAPEGLEEEQLRHGAGHRATGPCRDLGCRRCAVHGESRGFRSRCRVHYVFV